METNEELGRKITQFDLGWLIGVIDGEGCFSIYRNKNRYCGVFRLNNTNFNITTKFSGLLTQVGIEWTTFTVPKSEKCRSVRQITVATYEDIQKLCTLILPYMECRFDQAWLLNEFVKLRLNRMTHQTGCGEEESSLYILLKKENHKGDF